MPKKAKALLDGIVFELSVKRNRLLDTGKCDCDFGGVRCDEEMGKRGRTSVMYTLERAEEVRNRVRNNGEFLTANCAEMGMSYEKLLRWCRRNKFKIHDQASRAKARAVPRGPYPIGEKIDPLRQPRAGGRAAAIVDDWRAGKLAPREIAAKHGVGYEYAIRLRKLVGLNPPAG